MSYSVAMVGAGPTTIYTLQALLALDQLPGRITIHERQRRAGQGTPYSAHWSDPVMLANIASIEIPTLPTTLVEWLGKQSDPRLEAFGIARAEIDERAFYPRLILGEYLADQFVALLERARTAGVVVDLRTQSTVTDVRIVGRQIELTALSARGLESKGLFEYVVLATGHQWPSDPEARPGYFTSPWPASALARIRNCAVGMRGTSLSAIDAAVVLADHHGEFVKFESGELEYVASPGTEAFAITMLSRKGLLPEADFYHTIPYIPLTVCTPEAIADLISTSAPEHLLDDAFALFERELRFSDPAYVRRLCLKGQSMEEFCEAYFAQRAGVDPFVWAEQNLADSIADAEREVTVPWRYAILRMHEVLTLVVPHLGDADYTRFISDLKPVFVDNYATVPHESIRRVLALRRATKLEVERLDDGLRIDTKNPSVGADLWRRGKLQKHFPAFVEATGQRALSAKDFPFPSLRRQGVIRDLSPAGENHIDRGIAIDDQFHPIGNLETSERLFCLSLPYLLGQHPFAQGITSSAQMGAVVARAIEEMQSVVQPTASGTTG